MKRRKLKPELDDSISMFIGLDAHKNYLQSTIVDYDGVVMSQERIERSREAVEEFSNRLPKARIVIESSSAWRDVYEVLSKRHEVVLSNPVKTKAIASAKVETDKVDSLTLAQLLRVGLIPESYIPPKSVIELRDLVRYRASLVRIRATVKNKIHAYLLMNGLTIEGTPFSKPYMEKLWKIENYRIQGYLRIIETLNLEIHEASKIISTEAINNPEAKLLMNIPGISFYSALLIASEIDDITRFPDSAHLVSYAGLTPSTYSSGSVTYHGRITKAGSSYLRWGLNQCTRAHMRAEPEGDISRFYKRLARKKGDAKAIVAASSKLLKVVYWVLREKRAYRS